MKDEKDYLYQDLPSIKPRISREERISLRRSDPCLDCNPHMERAKRSAKHLYFFYIAILGIGVIATQLYQRRNPTINELPEIVTPSRKISASISRTINLSLIDDNFRYGLSFLIRNNSSREWNISTLNIRIKNTDFNTNITINTNISRDTFFSTFIPLEQRFSDINDIEVLINP